MASIETDFIEQKGYLGQKGTIKTAQMTMADAKAEAAAMPDCGGFTHRGKPEAGKQQEIFFKSRCDFEQGDYAKDPWTSYQKPHHAWLTKGNFVAWPPLGSRWDAKEALVPHDKYGYLDGSDKMDVLRFTDTKEPPCTTTFVDGIGVTHVVTVDADHGVEIIIPLTDETIKRKLNVYKQIEWGFWNGDDWAKERSCTDEGATLAYCTFTYEPKSTFHNHGIRIRVQAYSPWLTARTASEHAAAEQKYWQDGVLKDAAPFIHQYFKLLQDHAKEVRKGLKAGAETLDKSQAVEDLNTALLPWIKKAFAHHHKSKVQTETLDKEEAAAFFAHVVDERGPFSEVVCAELNPTFEKATEDYKKNKATKDAEALAVLSGSEGELKLDQVIHAMMIGDAKNAELLKALGFELKENDCKMM